MERMSLIKSAESLFQALRTPMPSAEDADGKTLESVLLGTASTMPSRKPSNGTSPLPDCLTRTAQHRCRRYVRGTGETAFRPTLPSIAAEMMQWLKSAFSTSQATTSDGQVPAMQSWTPCDKVLDQFFSAEAPDELGRLAGFRILKILGCDMGAVFLAEDIQLRRPVAPENHPSKLCGERKGR